MNWFSICFRLIVATCIGCVIGMEREHRHRPAGMRTHVLVCLGAAIIAVLETLLVENTMVINAAANVSGIAVSRGRLSAQVISGIGFLGAGTIFMSRRKVTGLTTAASLWNAGCLGLAVGMGYYGLAIIGCMIVLGTLTVMQKLVVPASNKHIEAVYAGAADTTNIIRSRLAEAGVFVIDLDVQLKKQDDSQMLTTDLFTVSIPAKIDLAKLLLNIAALDGVLSVRTIERDM